MLGKTPQVGQGGSFRTSEWGATAGAQKAKQRKFNTEITAEQHFPAKKQLACPPWGLGVEVQALGVRYLEEYGLDCLEDTLKGLV